jgi:glucose/mannose-6-phosphate isomerase
MPMDNIGELKKRLDSYNMFDMISSMPDQLEEGISIGEKADLKGLESETFHTVVLAGMGGSAIAGDLLKSLLVSEMQVPFIVQRHYRLPRFVNKRALVICSSYSGNTEETLSAFENALINSAHVIAISTGGKLAIKAVSNKVPFVALPEGLPPRAALGYSFASLLHIFWRLGLCGNADQDVISAARAMRERNALFQPDNNDNPALSLALKIKGRIPVLFAGQDSLDAVAARFKGQVCENAKTLAYASQFPECNHNEIVGWGGLNGMKNKLIAIIIRDSGDHKRVLKRFEIVSRYMEDQGIEVLELSTEEGSNVSRNFLMIQLIDYCSYYLALLNGVDPYPVEAIDYLKRKLAD